MRVYGNVIRSQLENNGENQIFFNAETQRKAVTGTVEGTFQNFVIKRLLYFNLKNTVLEKYWHVPSVFPCLTLRLRVSALKIDYRCKMK